MFKMSCGGCYFFAAGSSGLKDGVCTKLPPVFDQVRGVTRYPPIPEHWVACGCFCPRLREQALLDDLQRREGE
jgi:hypothetical protein